MSIERREKGEDVGEDVEIRVDGRAIVHQHGRRAVVGDDARHFRVALKAPHVVDDRRPGLDRGRGDRAP